MSRERFEPRCLATAIGSVPHADPGKACRLVARFLPEIPVWPQLPKRSFLENMYAQFSEGFPGVVVEGERIYVDRSQDLDEPLERLYTAYLEDAVDRYAISPDHAAGLHAFLSTAADSPIAVKGQVVGPISFGLTVTDQERRPVIYDETLADALAKHLRLKATWQERRLKAISPSTIIFVDEPYMSSFGSAFVSLSREQVLTLLEEVFKGIEGLKGVHCCGNTDWSILLSTSADILSLDAYTYAQPLSLYPDEVKAFIERDGVIAWGIVPSNEESLAGETVKSLIDRLEEAIGMLDRKGIPFDRLVERSLITPSCGLEPLSVDAAEWALELTAGVSRDFRKRRVKEA